MRERPNLEIFKEDIRFKNWLQVYAGLRHGWLSSLDVFRLIDDGLLPCSQDRHVELYLALEKSRFAMWDLIKEYISTDMNITITHNEESYENYEFPYIPLTAWAIWELEFLLRIRNSEKSLEDKIDEIYHTWCDFKYLSVDWSKFLWLSYATPMGMPPADINQLYPNFLNHIAKLIAQLQ